MKHVKNEMMKRKARTAIADDFTGAHSLSEAYKSYSKAKEKAFDYCLELYRLYNGMNYRIVSAGTFAFSFEFLGTNLDTGEIAYFFITKEHERYINLSEI